MSSFFLQSTLHYSYFGFISLSPQFVLFISPTTVHLLYIYLVWLYSYYMVIQVFVSFTFQPISSPEINDLRVSSDKCFILDMTYRISWTLDARDGQWTLDAGPWTLDSRRWTLDAVLWTLDSGLCTLDAGLSTLDSGRWTLDSRLWTLEAGLWTLDTGRWTLDATLRKLSSGH